MGHAMLLHVVSFLKISDSVSTLWIVKKQLLLNLFSLSLSYNTKNKTHETQLHHMSHDTRGSLAFRVTCVSLFFTIGKIDILHKKVRSNYLYF